MVFAPILPNVVASDAMDRTIREETCRIALVSGGGRGIGRAVARAFALAGTAVAIGSRTMGEVDAVARECRELGVPALALDLDVTDAASCEEAVARCERTLGPIDVLMNNAGVLTVGRFSELDNAVWERTIAVNLTGAFNMTHAVLPGMLTRGSGTVIAMSSIAGKIGAKYYTAYSASKHGLIGFMRALAVEYARSGVTFNCVCPAYTDTPATHDIMEKISERTGKDREAVLRAALTPQGRLVQPEEVAELCLFLAGPAGRGINGQAINVDGGQVQW